MRLPKFSPQTKKGATQRRTPLTSRRNGTTNRPRSTPSTSRGVKRGRKGEQTIPPKRGLKKLFYLGLASTPIVLLGWSGDLPLFTGYFILALKHLKSYLWGE